MVNAGEACRDCGPGDDSVCRRQRRWNGEDGRVMEEVEEGWRRDGGG